MSSGLSLYIHVPFCVRKCGYCSFVSYSDRAYLIPAYVYSLINEISLTQRPQSTIETIYFGGGTPSVLSDGQIAQILNKISEIYTLVQDAEITLEANPGKIDAKYLSSMKSLGVNRMSLGIQSLNDEDLRFLGRSHLVNEAWRAIFDSRQAGFNNLSLDFIYGLPNRTTDKWESMLDEIIDLGAEHLSLYGLTLEADTPLGQAVTNGEAPAPDADQEATEYEIACVKLGAAGYRHYEISNWARPGFESRHNSNYWKRGEYLGLGVAAHSFIDGSRISNTVDLDEYLETIGCNRLPQADAEVISQELALSETIFLGLRLEEGISMDDIGRQFSIDLRSKFAAEITELSELGLVETSFSRLKLTSKGRLLGNEVFLRFLPS